MIYRWKPDKAQRAKYAEGMRQKERMNIVSSKGPIRNGCKVKWFSVSDAVVYEGVIEKNNYGEKTGQHTFSIRLLDGCLKRVRGRNLYNNLLEHVQGDISKQWS